jgi:DNA-binding Lrp family transcriptional regulator
MSEKVVLDSIDKAILRSLQNNGRIANKDLAAAVGVAPSTCMSRVDRLRRTGVVTGFSVDVDPAAIPSSPTYARCQRCGPSIT